MTLDDAGNPVSSSEGAEGDGTRGGGSHIRTRQGEARRLLRCGHSQGSGKDGPSLPEVRRLPTARWGGGAGAPACSAVGTTPGNRQPLSPAAPCGGWHGGICKAGDPCAGQVKWGSTWFGFHGTGVPCAWSPPPTARPLLAVGRGSGCQGPGTFCCHEVGRGGATGPPPQGQDPAVPTQGARGEHRPNWPKKRQCSPVLFSLQNPAAAWSYQNGTGKHAAKKIVWGGQPRESVSKLMNKTVFWVL